MKLFIKHTIFKSLSTERREESRGAREQTGGGVSRGRDLSEECWLMKTINEKIKHLELHNTFSNTLR